MSVRPAAILAAALLAAPAAAQEADPIGETLREAVRPTPPADAAPPVSETPPPAGSSLPGAESPAAPVASAAPQATAPAVPATASPMTSDPGAEEAEDALPAGPIPYTPQIVPPRAPAPYRPSASATYTYEDYDARLRSSFASAQGLLGALDGGWILTDAAGRRLFAFQLVDKGSSDGLVEGVWRDLRRTPTPLSSGLIGTIHRFGGQLTMSFAASRGGFTTVTLAQGLDGAWTGRLAEPGGERAVTMRRGD